MHASEVQHIFLDWADSFKQAALLADSMAFNHLGYKLQKTSVASLKHLAKPRIS